MSFPLRLEAISPLEYFASLVAEDEHFALLEAAVSLGQDAEPELDTQAVLDQIEALGDKLKRRLPADASAMHRLRTLNRYFFRELGFAGNVNDYYDAGNSYLHHVLASRRGIPISLALVYIELAGHAGLIARGVSFPGHFLVKLRLPNGEAVMDPFNGRSIDSTSGAVPPSPPSPWRGEIQPADNGWVVAHGTKRALASPSSTSVSVAPQGSPPNALRR